MEQLWDTLNSHPAATWALVALAFWALLALAYFKGAYAWERFAPKEGTHKALRAAAYVGSLPLRLAFALFSAAVTTLVVGLLIAFLWAIGKAARG
jgi:hypothetical protein